MTNEIKKEEKPKKTRKNAKTFLPMDKDAPKNRRKPSAKAKKMSARLCAVQGIYQTLQTGETAAEVFDQYRKFRFKKVVEDIDYVEADLDLLAGVMQGTETCKNDLIPMIDSALGATRAYDDLELLLKSICLCGVFELVAHAEIDKGVIINDYVEVTKAFYDDKQPSLVNAVLDRIALALRA